MSKPTVKQDIEELFDLVFGDEYGRTVTRCYTELQPLLVELFESRLTETSPAAEVLSDDLGVVLGSPAVAAAGDPRKFDSDDEEQSKVYRDRIADIIWSEMFGSGTSTGVMPMWVWPAVRRIWDEFTCRGCGFGIVDLGVSDRQCNDCAPRLKAEGL